MEKVIFTNCERCIAYLPTSPNGGKCLRHPPLCQLVPVQTVGGQSLSGVSYWPEVRASEGCCEGQERPLALNA